MDVARDPARAAALYQTACDAGVLAACNRLGALYERQDAARAVALYRKACEG
ncbi:MAG: sel1 repeat family protein, partial [Gemmatimonadetes bacterium]